ncbi:MAG: diaminopimelate epimerase [Mycobacterium leprae]
MGRHAGGARRALPFVKGHGTENDFVLLPDPDGTLDLAPSFVRALCDRRAGVGADGVLRVVRTAAAPDAAALAESADWFMDYRNADGGAVEMCGNGVRVFARYLVTAGLAPPGRLPVATRAGVKVVQVPPTGDVTVDMGPCRPLAVDGLSVAVGSRRWTGAAVSVGNPHVVVFLRDLAEAGDLREPPTVHPDGAFPSGTNVEFVVPRGERRVAMRVHERGVGETRSCGTGACAAALAAARRDERRGSWDAEWVVEVPGGRLRVREQGDGHVELSGPAVLVAAGELDPQWVEEARG